MLRIIGPVEWKTIESIGNPGKFVDQAGLVQGVEVFFEILFHGMFKGL